MKIDRSIDSVLSFQVTLYNLKCDPVFDFGEGPRNDMYYNRFGNILILCGFGNIASGRMQFWDVDTRREIVTVCFFQSLNFNLVESHFLTTVFS